jgi:tRNA G18 (ribose-2'-O)-methylase SpoU
VKLVKGLKGEGWNVYGLEEDARAIPLETGGSLAPPVICLANQAGVPSKKQEQTSVGHPVFQILIVGNEVTGVDPDLLDLCDQILYIPMRGEKKSFNVAIAFSIAAYALTAEKVET